MVENSDLGFILPDSVHLHEGIKFNLYFKSE